MMPPMPASMSERIRIVLVNTTHPGNIGAVARAMKTMGLTRLHLVGPQGFPSAEATARAAGADDILARATVCADLDAALTGARLILGTSARARSISWPELDPRQAIAEAANTAGDVAILFGRERYGLTNEELQRCHYLVKIPANPEFRSLNIASAVQVLAYELRMAQPVAENPEEDTGELFATAEDMEGFYAHLENTLLETGFLSQDKPRVTMMKRLRRLFNRARPDQTEINILRGILTSIQKPKNQKP